MSLLLRQQLLDRLDAALRLLRGRPGARVLPSGKVVDTHAQGPTGTMGFIEADTLTALRAQGLIDRITGALTAAGQQRGDR